MRRIKAHSLDEAPVILDGQMRQSNIVESCSAAGVSSYKIILFDCQDAERDRRLITRGHPELANARMGRWAKYLRDQALIRGDPIIDTTGLSPQQAVEALETELASEAY